MKTQYAQVIVDVATMQTNQPYTYVIPPELAGQVEAGMRVVVGFGRGKRRVQGFVVAVSAENPLTSSAKLKPILEVQDLRPVLNQEALQMADWLARYTYAFKITCLQAMLPAAMKAAYTKTVSLTTSEVTPAVREMFAQKSELALAKLSPEQKKLLVPLSKQGKIEINYHVKDRAKSKLVLAIKRSLSEIELQAAKAKLRKGAKKQAQLLDYLQTLPLDKEVFQANAQAKTGLGAAIFKAGAEKGWLKQSKVESYRNPYKQEVVKTEAKSLLPQQAQVVQAINQASDEGKAQTFLLQGITGSGKTEVYLHAISHVLAQGKQALLLVPEISLTPQMVSQVKARFGKEVAMLHSGLSDGEKYDEWRRIERGEAQVVVGARSAIFAPLPKLGLIIMDEEHEASYKQDDMPRYHARDVAIWRSEYHACPLILGSATPSLETRARAQKGVYGWLKLTHRANGKALPAVSLIDMKKEIMTAPVQDISQVLLAAIKQKLAQKEQVVLMLNRRGYSSFAMCRECGFVLKCPNCDISLTMHLDSHSMRCHYCGHEQGIPSLCPSCHSKRIGYYGTGTEKVETELKELLPTARILRMDVDTTRKKGAHEKILRQFGARKADILLGTQMIAKGLDFPNVTLVGVLNADTALELPDFRASERTFQLLTQVSGRAGRAQKQGEVLIQTFNPENYAIKLAQKQDYERYFRMEMAVRHRGGYPPYFYTIKITTSYRDEATAAKKIFQIAGQLKQVLSPTAQILGPSPRSVMRVNNRYYYQLVIKYKRESLLEDYLQHLLLISQKEERQGLRIVIDREPINFI